MSRLLTPREIEAAEERAREATSRSIEIAGASARMTHQRRWEALDEMTVLVMSLCQDVDSLVETTDGKDAEIQRLRTMIDSACDAARRKPLGDTRDAAAALVLLGSQRTWEGQAGQHK